MPLNTVLRIMYIGIPLNIKNVTVYVYLAVLANNLRSRAGNRDLATPYAQSGLAHLVQAIGIWQRRTCNWDLRIPGSHTTFIGWCSLIIMAVHERINT